MNSESASTRVENVEQRGADRFLVGDDDDAHALADAGCRVDADDPSRGANRQRITSRVWSSRSVSPAVVDRLDRRRFGTDKKQLVLAAASQDDRFDARAVEQLHAQLVRQLLARRFGEGQDRELRGMDAVLQQLIVIARDRREVDQRHAQHDEENCREKQAAGQAMGRQPPAKPCRSSVVLQHGIRKHQFAAKSMPILPHFVGQRWDLPRAFRVVPRRSAGFWGDGDV